MYGCMWVVLAVGLWLFFSYLEMPVSTNHSLCWWNGWYGYLNFKRHWLCYLV